MANNPEINLNDTTPAAPSGKANVKWQTDGNGNVSAYMPPATATVPGAVPTPPNSTTEFFRGDATFDQVTDADLSVSDITTNNVSTSAHGFAPKLPNDATKFFDGTGAYSTPAGGSSVVSKTTTYTANAGEVVLCNASGGTFAVTLPQSSANASKVVTIKKTDSSANAVTVTPHSGDTVDGQSSWTINFQGSSMTIIFDGGTNGDII